MHVITLNYGLVYALVSFTLMHCQNCWYLIALDKFVVVYARAPVFSIVSSFKVKKPSLFFFQSSQEFKSDFLRVSRIGRHSRKIDFSFISPKHTFE